MKPLIAVAVLAVAAPAFAQAPAQPPAPAVAPEWRPLDPENTLVVDTTKGRFIVEMRPEAAPLAVARIKALARRGYYDNSLFYRVLNSLAQGGDKADKSFRSDLPDLRAEFTFKPGAGIPYYSAGTIPNGEIGFVGSLPVTVEKYSDGSQQGWALFCPGVASMPHYDDPHTANSQVFFMKQRATNLEKTFTAWGRVVSGQEVVDALNAGEPPPNPDKMTRVRVLADIPEAERPKLEVIDPRSRAFAVLSHQVFVEKGRNFTLCDIKLPVRPAP
ncbi:MAG TPA: peptidylprolyl isomerase [Caulobacteraceae bacterium]|jgi:peptidylprolyl isomerase